MKKGNEQKLNLFFSGIDSKFKNDTQYFENIEMVFKSGNKKFMATAEYNENEFKLIYNGVITQTNLSKIFSFFIDEQKKYDISEFIYNKRGEQTIISCNHRDVTLKTQNKSEILSNPLIKQKEYLIKIDEAKNLLKEINILTSDYKIKNDMIRKYNQINHFVEIIAPMFNNYDKEISILDCGCGKSYLSFALNHYLCDVLKKRVRIIGIDYSENVISKSRNMAKNLNYNNMEFFATNLKDYSPPNHINTVIALHACDVATDYALNIAIKCGADNIICAPCCQKELLNQFKIDGLESILKHGILRHRMNDIITDGLRAAKLESLGYETTMLEYTSPIDTPKNIMIKAQKKRSISTCSSEYNKLRQLLSTESTLDKFFIE